MAMLLPELIRKIVLHAIEGPHCRREIILLSHVSKLWRDVVLGVSALFTQANWGKWPFWLVDAWCSRAGSRLLTICVGKDLLCRMEDTPGAPYRALLNKLAVQVGKLECQGMPSGVLSLQMPSLQHLHLFNAHGELMLESENLPMLRDLSLTMSKPRILTSLPHVSRLHYFAFLPDLRDDGAHILSQLPRLQHLTLTIMGKGIQWVPEQPILLPSLFSLEVRWLEQIDVNTLRLVLNAFSFPELQTIVLHDAIGYEGHITLFQSLGQLVPHLRSFSFIGSFCPDIWLTILPVLITPTSSNIWPDLREISFSRHKGTASECTDEHYARLREFVLARKGTLTRLGIPRMKNMGILQPLKDHVDLFEVPDKPYWIPPGTF